MSHVDEGALHAYLDGALDEYPVAEAARIREHLDACAACAERLEEERAIRTDAHAILGLAAPEVEVPSFEELRAYVERTRPKGGSLPTRSYRMRMAASIAIALGTGWVLRGGLPNAPLSVPEPAMESIVAPADAGRERSVATAAGSTGERVAARPAVAEFDEQTPDAAADEVDASILPAISVDGLEDRSVVAQAARRSDSGAGGGATIGSAVSTGAEIGSAPEPSIRALPEAELRAAEADVVAEKALAEADAVPADAETTADAETSDVDAGLASDDLVRLEEGAEDMVAMAEPAAPAAASDSAADEDEAPGEDERERRARSAGAPVTSAMERNTFASRRASPDDLEPVTDIPALSVAGYDVVTVTNLGEGTAPVGTHVVQRFEDGETFEIFHLEPDVSRDAVPMPATGSAEVEVLTEGGWIVLQGPRSTEDLEELLAALFPTG